MMRALRLAVTMVMLLVVTTACGPFGGDKMKVSALLPDSAGLFVGNDVGVLGVNVGKITAITPRGSDVRVDMEIEGDVSVPSNAGAVVVARSVATDRYVELTPVYKSGPKMASGTVINADRTRTPVDFDEVLASLNEFATGIGGNDKTRLAVQRTLAAQDKALKGKGELVNRTIHSLSDAVNGISAQRSNITATVTSLDTLFSKIAADQQTARTFIQQVAKASQILAEERVNFQEALRSLKVAVTATAEFAKTNRTEIIGAMNNTSSILESILERRTQLTEVLEVFPVGLQNLKQAVKNGRLVTRIDPLQLTSLGGLLDGICDTGGLSTLCDQLGTKTVGDLLAVLLGGTA